MARIPLVLLSVALGALPLQGQSPKPLWEVDLSRYGYDHRPATSLAYASPGSPNSFVRFSTVFQQGISFTDPNVVAAFFVVYDTVATASEPRETTTSDSFRLIAVFLNAKNGELIRKLDWQLDWPLPHDQMGVSQFYFYPAAQGRFIVVLGNAVSLYSADFKLLAHFESHGEMTPIASASGNSLLLHTTNGQAGDQYDLLDTKNLSILKSWGATGRQPFQPESLWDDRIAGQSPTGLYFRTATSEPKKLLAVRHGFCDSMGSGASSMPGNMCAAQESVLTLSGDFCHGWQFVGGDSLTGTLCGGDSKLLTVSTDGKITRKFNLGLEREDGSVIPSANGHRFVIPTMRWGLGKNDTPDKQTARVFDSGFENPLLTLSLPRSPISSRGLFYSYGDRRFGWGGLALSPDGSLLAVQAGPAVRIYSVPDKPAASQCTQNCSSLAAVTNVQSHPHAVWSPASALVERMLSWFPADTETMTGATGPLVMPKMSRDAHGGLSMDSSDDLVRDTFKEFFMLPALRLEKEFRDTPIAEVIEGSRTFRPPSGLGMASYQGGLIAVFTEDVTVQASAFIKDSASTAVRTEQVAGVPVEVFQDKSEEDMLTTYISFPKPNLVVVATDESYLRDVLSRIGGKQGERALPDSLPEWKRVDTNAAFWAVRHFSKTETMNGSLLPTNCRAGRSTDEKPIGLTFSFSPGASNVATIDYLSGDEDYLRCIPGELFRQSEPGVAEMRMHYTEAQSGVLEGSYNLDEFESARYFVFVLEALLGHPIFV